MAYVKTHVVARRNARGGRSAQEHLVAALRCLYQRAVEDGLITEADNPARKVAKPRRLPSTRRAVPDTRLAEINETAAATGDDPELDTLLLRLHTETACRRGGALALRPRDLDPDQCLILLREKGETVRWQPVSPTLMARLIEHGQQRHAPPDGQLLRYAGGRPITSRRYDHLWGRIGRHLPWVATQQISMHWIRHTTLTWVEAELRVRRRPRLRRHSDSGSETAATAAYVPSSLAEVAAALAALTSEPHPLSAIRSPACRWWQRPLRSMSPPPGSSGLLLKAAAATGRPTAVVDLTGTEFCDSSGLHTLLRAITGPWPKAAGWAWSFPRRCRPQSFEPHRPGPSAPCFSSLAEALAPAPAPQASTAGNASGVAPTEPGDGSGRGHVTAAR